MRFIKWVEHRQSVLWHMEPKASKRLIRSWDQVIFLWHWPRKRYMDMSALTRSPARVEILVLADETANPRYVTADLLSQAEHDEMASAILITTSEELADKVSEEVDGFVKKLSRQEIIQKSLDSYGYILVADTMEEAIETANEIASEHLEISYERSSRSR